MLADDLSRAVRRTEITVCKQLRAGLRAIGAIASVTLASA